MLSTLLGLPIHPLIVHATVVIVPSAAMAVLTAAVWPRFRRWARWGPLALSLAAVVLAPLSTSSGEALQHMVGDSALIEKHSELGDQLMWWVIPLALLAAAGYWLNTFRGGRPEQRSRALTVVLTVLSVAVAVGVLVQIVLIGHSGAEAVWSGSDAAGTPLTSVISLL